MEINAEMIWPLVVLVLVAAIGILGVVMAIQSYKQLLFYKELNRRGQTVMGKIVRIRKEYGSYDSSDTYYPVFSYQVNGQHYEVEAHPLFFENFTVGQEMPLRFLPENPTEYTWRKTLKFSLVMVLIGVFLAVGSVAFLYKIDLVSKLFQVSNNG